MKFNIQVFKKHLQAADIVMIENEIKGSLTYLSYGLEIREKLYDLAINSLKGRGFLEIKLSDLILKSDILKLDPIAKVSDNYFYVNGTNFAMAAGHEIPFYLFLKKYLRSKPSISFPINFFHFGAVFRFPKNTKFPFSLGERRSFLENYIVYKDKKEGENHLINAIQWNRDLIKNTLYLPSIEVDRPLSTNKPFSRKTVCIDSLTPLGITVITGMSYLHSDIFTHLLNVKRKNWSTNKNEMVYAIHFGISDHIFFSYLLNSHDGRGFRLLNKLSPYQVSILLVDKVDENSDKVKKLINYLNENKYSFNLRLSDHKKINPSLDENIVKGIPLSIIISEKDSGSKIRIMHRSDCLEHDFDLKNIDSIRYLLEKNDQDIINNFKKREIDTIVDCQSMAEVNATVANGKVGRIYLENTDIQVKEAEEKLTSGEILGFVTTKVPGKNIFTGELTPTQAYISRRS